MMPHHKITKPAYRHDAHMIEVIDKIASGANPSDVLEASQLGKDQRMEAYNRAMQLQAMRLMNKPVASTVGKVDIDLSIERRHKKR